MGLLESSAVAARGLRHSTHFEPSTAQFEPSTAHRADGSPHAASRSQALAQPTRATTGASGPRCRPPRRSKIRRVDHSIKERESTIVVKERLIKAYAHVTI